MPDIFQRGASLVKETIVSVTFAIVLVGRQKALSNQLAQCIGLGLRR